MQCLSSYCYQNLQTPLGLSPNTSTITAVKYHKQRHQRGADIIKSSQHLDQNTINCSVSEANAKTITSTSNPFVKHCVKLRQSSSYRHSHGSALIVGTTLIREIDEFHKLKPEQITSIECLFLLDKVDIPQDLCEVPGERVYVNSLVMKKLAGVQSIESIEAVALMRYPSTFVDLNDSNNQLANQCKSWFPQCHRILVLEGIQDPGNLGTLLRSALAFKWNGVFLLPGCCDPFNEKALRASRGAAFQLPIVSGSWTHLESFSKEVKLKLLAGHPDSSSKAVPVSKLSQEFASSLAYTPLCLLLGSEGSGLSGKAKDFCELVSIPMSDHFESLNVAVAGGIFMFLLGSDNITA